MLKDSLEDEDEEDEEYEEEEEEDEDLMMKEDDHMMNKYQTIFEIKKLYEVTLSFRRAEEKAKNAKHH
jgi:hypothetical protein